MIEFFKQKNELKHARRSCRQFVLEMEEQARARCDYLMCTQHFVHTTDD